MMRCRTKFGRNALVLLAVAVLASCGAVQSAGGRADSWERYKNEAFLLASGSITKTATRGVTREDDNCKGVVDRQIAFTDDKPNDLVVAAYVGKCTGPAAMSVIVMTAKAGNPETYNYRVNISDDADNWVFRAAGLPPAEQWVEKRLKDLVSLEPFSATGLPEWPATKTEPIMPTGVFWIQGTDRATYEAIRAANAPIWCMSTGANVPDSVGPLQCFAATPSRSKATLVVELGNFDLYGAKTPQEALDVVLGKTPTLTDAEARSREIALAGTAKRAAEQVVRVVEPPPGPLAPVKP